MSDTETKRLIYDRVTRNWFLISNEERDCFEEWYYSPGYGVMWAYCPAVGNPATLAENKEAA